jgi:5-formyltetrahydrofolate cyclo-ligase
MSLAPSEVVRRTILEKLRALSTEDIVLRSNAIIHRLAAASPDEAWKNKTVALFRPLKLEVQLGPLELELRRQGAKLCYPRISDSDACLMQFVRLDDPSHPENWEPGPYGGLEPRAEFPEVPTESLDVIAVPGLAFGLGGERTGRGKGFYDRFLERNHTALRLALCFDFQLFPALQQNSWDQRVHQIVTEDRFVKVSL